MLTEEQAEIAALTDLATNLGDGMTTLKPSNISRPIAGFGDMPEDLAPVPAYVERFLAWQFDRVTDPEMKAKWSSPESEKDVLRYVRRKVWQAKVESGSVINPVARMLAATVTLHRGYRADVHEAVNHSVKHNEDIKTLLPEMREQLDEVVRARLEQTTQMLAGVALATVPQLQEALQRQALTYERPLDTGSAEQASL